MVDFGSMTKEQIDTYLENDTQTCKLNAKALDHRIHMDMIKEKYKAFSLILIGGFTLGYCVTRLWKKIAEKRHAKNTDETNENAETEN